MSRTLSAEAQALLNTGHIEGRTAVVITLGNGTVLRLSSAEFTIDGQLFTADLEETDALKMGLDTTAVDRTTLKIQNVDKLFGQQLTGASDALEGATAMLGFAFREANNPNAPWFYDEKMPGDIIAGAVDQNRVELKFLADIYGALVVGETVSSVFPYQQEKAIAPRVDPNDLPGGGGGEDGENPRRRGRLREYNYL